MYPFRAKITNNFTVSDLHGNIRCKTTFWENFRLIEG